MGIALLRSSYQVQGGRILEEVLEVKLGSHEGIQNTLCQVVSKNEGPQIENLGFFLRIPVVGESKRKILQLI